jgi:HEAT repeat protein
MGFIKQAKSDSALVAPDSAEEILRALSAPDPVTRSQAARAAAAYPECRPMLLAHLATEPELAVRANLLTTLIKTQSAEVAQGLIAYLRSEDVSLRNDVITALQQMPQAIAPHMPALLRDPDMDVRIFALSIVRGMRSPEVEAWLLDVIAHESNMNVCATALDALAEIGTPDMIPAIQTLSLRFNNEFIRFAVDVATRRISV